MRFERVSKVATVAVLALLIAPLLGASALAADGLDSQQVFAREEPLVRVAPLAPQAAPAPAQETTVLNPGGEPLTAEQAISRVATSPIPSVVPINPSAPASDHPAPFEFPHDEQSSGPTPLADTDMNNIDNARWINRTDTQFLGENINGANDGSNRRTDIDWWRFRLGYTAISADTISFSITKDAWDHLEVYVFAWPDADPEGVSYLARYEYMNRSQGLGQPSNFSFTAFEDGDYVMLVQSMWIRAGCCMVNYTITNIGFSTAVPADDNNNRTKSEAMTTGAPPRDREVDQSADWFDVYDMTGQLTIDENRGDDADITIGFSVSEGRTGFTDVYNGSLGPLGGADADTVVSYGIFQVVYQDRANYWRVFSPVLVVPGQTGSTSGLINGTPAYLVVRVAAQGVASGVLSSVPGSVKYNVTSFTVQEDHAPTLSSNIPSLNMLEDNPASGMNLIDLAPFFTDDIDAGSLWFTVSFTQFAFVQATITGTQLTVRVNQPEWSGTVNLRVAAHDLSWDRVASVDDHITHSNYFLVSVQAVNDAPRILTFGGQPVAGPSLSFSLAQGQTLVLSAVATDPEDNLSLTWSLTPSPAFATFNTGTGQLTLAPSNGDVGNHSLAITVRDPSAATANLTVNVRVNNVNDPPRFIDIGGFDPATSGPLEFQATQGDLFVLSLRVYDADVWIGMPDMMNYAADQGYISIAVDPANTSRASLSFTPTNSHVGTLTVRLSVGDGPVGSFYHNVTVLISVLNRNDPPSFTHVGTVSGVYQLGTSRTFSFLGLDGAMQGQDFVLSVRADDIDVAGALGDSLTFETNMPGKVFLTPNSNGLSADLLFVATQADVTAGQIQIVVYVNDTLAPTMGDVLTIIIDIMNVNDPPVLAPVVSLTMTEDVAFSYTFEATDPDGDTITFSSDSELFPVEATTGSIDFTPTNADIGGAEKIIEVTITARDTASGVTTMRITVIIENANDAPTAAQIQNPAEGERFRIGESVTFTGTAVDVDKDETATLSYSWFVDGLEIGEGKTVASSFTNEAETPRTLEVRMMVTDAHGASTNKTMSISIEGKPKPQPGFEGAAALAAVAGVAVAAALAARRRRLE